MSHTDKVTDATGYPVLALATPAWDNFYLRPKIDILFNSVSTSNLLRSSSGMKYVYMLIFRIIFDRVYLSA